MARRCLFGDLSHCYPQGRRSRAPLDEFHGPFGGQPLIVFDRSHDTVLQRLQFLRPHLGFEFLRQGASALPELAGIFLSHSQPVVGGATVLFHAAALKMGQPDKILGRNESFFSRLQIAFDGVIQTGGVDGCGSADDGAVAFIEQQEQQLEPARYPQFLKDPEKVVLYGMFAEPQLICDLLVALSLRGVLGHLQFPLRQQAELTVLHAVAGRRVTERLKHVLSLVAPSPDLPALDVLNAVVEFRDRIGSAEHCRLHHSEKRQLPIPACSLQAESRCEYQGEPR